jgi:hypothetical protein
MSRWSRVAAVLTAAYILFLASSCRLPEPVLSDGPSGQAPMPVDSTTIYVVRHGWHAGIAIRRAHLPADRLPDLPGVPETRFLEVGWGERHYYPSPDPGVGTFLRAGAWPTGSVVHAVPISGSVRGAFPQQRILRIRIGARDLDRLAAFLRASLHVQPPDAAPDSIASDSATSPQAVPAAPGYYPDSRFFASPLRYHLFQNCNHWIAEALEAAGCPTARWRAATVGLLLRQAKACASGAVQGEK